jgi:Flp pilus assembly protein TadG
VSGRFFSPDEKLLKEEAMKRFRNENGQTLVLTALCMTALLGFMGLALDVGILFRAKRQIQIAADATATAAALDYYYNISVQQDPLTHAKNAGKSASSSNGVTDGTNGTVSINCAPTKGPNAGVSCNGYFEAVVSKPTGTIFMSTFSKIIGGNNFGSINVTSRAVAGMPVASDACMWIMDPHGSDDFIMQGNTQVNAPGCGIYVNSDNKSPGGVRIQGGSNNFNGPSFTTPGGLDSNGGGKNTTPTPITTGAPAQSPPIPMNLTGPIPNGGTDQAGNVQPPACQGANTATMATISTTANVPSPMNGVVCFNAVGGGATTLAGGLSLPGSSSGIVYLFQHGVNIGSGGAVTLGSGTYNSGTQSFTSTSGAVMDIYGGTLSEASNKQLNIYGPTSGTYNGIAIMQPRSNTTDLQVEFGSNSQTLDGIIYAPGALVNLHDNGGSSVTATGVIANKMDFKSSTITIPGYSKANMATTPFRVVTLTE